MKKNIKQLLAAGLSLSLLFGGCGTGTAGSGETEVEGSGADESTAGTGEVTELDWYINYSWYNTKFGGNVVSDEITKQTGVDINFVTPSGNEAERLNSLIASDSLPDMITLGWWEDQLDTMIDKNMIYALNELADAYDTAFWDVVDDTVVSWYTSDDGNLYCYPNSSFTPQDYEEDEGITSNQTFLVRKDIYEAIGSPDMTTPEGFAQAVRDAAAAFPEVDGEELIPIGSHLFTENGSVSFDQYLQNFIAVPYEENGEYYDRATDPDYVEWLKMFRRLGEEGYLKSDIFVDQRKQMEEKLETGRYFCMIYQRTDMVDQQRLLSVNHPERIYIAVDGPKNSNGDDHTLPGAGINGWTVTLISKNCEDPEKAIKLLSYLMSEEGQKLTYLGVEGVTYDVVDGAPVVKEEIKDLIDTDRTKYDETYGADNAYWMMQNNVMQMQWEWDDEDSVISQLKEWTIPYTCYTGHYEVNFAANTEEGVIDQRIKSAWGETLPKLLLAESEEEFDSVLADFVTKRERLGFEAYKEAWKKQVAESKAKLGLE